MSHELLTVAEMAEADRRTMASHRPGIELMENAGRAVAEAVLEQWRPCPTVVLCGPGNNGGDGFVAARHLKERGWDARVSLLGDRQALKGDAAEMAARWQGPVAPLGPASLDGVKLVVDAVFGAGLSKPIAGIVSEVFSQIAQRRLPVVAVDIPSGIHGDTGKVLGTAPEAMLTVTFCRKKLGHLLMPGRRLCGRLVVADIGIPDAVIEQLSVRTHENAPALWRRSFPRPTPESHKYDRGHTLIVSGGAASTGAARMAARGALRIGSGLVTVASPPDAISVNAGHLTAVMVRSFDSTNGLEQLLDDPRKNAVVIGPGGGVGIAMRSLVNTVLNADRFTVLDADALTSFDRKPEQLFERMGKTCVITPHDGEFRRLFPDIAEAAPDRVTAARNAAARSGAVVVLKAFDTVIAEPQGNAVVNSNAPPDLATAGAGDVLAGFIAGLMAQGMPSFEAAAAAVWIHGACGSYAGRGLIAEDLPEVLPDVLQDLDETIRP